MCNEGKEHQEKANPLYITEILGAPAIADDTRLFVCLDLACLDILFYSQNWVSGSWEMTINKHALQFQALLIILNSW